MSGREWISYPSIVPFVVRQALLQQNRDKSLISISTAGHSFRTW
ncbi:MAG: hypothetical protein Q7V05_04085 [Methanoregula sp.]|nr:hypothetical protein [Methanoregula sp.]MDP2797749.1 hypothetical protein [Methanoregula sp.]